MKLILALALAPVANPARELTKARAPGAVVIDIHGVHAAVNRAPDAGFCT
jgi:hypothetical protein